jgi:hypothetical protein
MGLHRKSLALCLLFFLPFPADAISQLAIPTGTVLPVQLDSSLNSRKAKAGQVVKARIMQEVPLPQHGRIPAGARVVGHIVAVSAAANGRSPEIALRFESVSFAHQSIPLSLSLRALASMTDVEDAQVPPSGPDRGTPAAWTTRNLVGGEVAYGEGGPVARGTQIVGQSLASGVLVPVRANLRSGCADVGGNDAPQALWVFSSDACGVYGLANLEIEHAGRTDPVGEITLKSRSGEVEIRGGSGMLLRVNGVNPQERRASRSSRRD